MGSYVELNDTLQITKEQGFPKELDWKEHLKKPYTAEQFANKVFEFTNTNRFKNTKYLNVVWTQLVNGVEVKKGTLNLDIDPMQIKTYEIDYDKFDSLEDCHINIIYFIQV